MSARLDTLQISKEAKEAGFNEKQAEFYAHYAQNLVNIIDSQIVTKQDVENLRDDIKGFKQGLELKLAEAKRDLELKLAEAKVDIIKWQIGTLFTVVGIIVAIFFKFSH